MTEGYMYKIIGQKIINYACSALLVTSIVCSSNADTADAIDSTQSTPLLNCPSVDELVKDDLWWSARNGAWKCYTQSFTTRIKSFIGAQWTGIKVGKVICLYIGDEAVAFPVALEQVHSQPILEPLSSSWSAPISNYKLCKSSNVADCGFQTQPAPDSSNIYDQIKYIGGNHDND